MQESEGMIRHGTEIGRLPGPYAPYVVEHFTPGNFKDFYMAERLYWKIEIEESTDLLALPSPWAGEPHPKAKLSLKRDQDRKKYRDSTLTEKIQMADTFRERVLLDEIWWLRRRLGDRRA